ncbi:MAG: HlyC/CorC family transporter, partial [SAR324 cluster bacterium]|nr:HlyC/CorC family transporter [SAR324 cluster bacterium]
GVMTFLLLFAGEITPKTFSLAFAQSLALPLVNILMFFHVIFLPVGWVLTRFIRALLWAVGKGTEERPRVTEEDLEYIVSLGRRQGAIDQEKETLLISVFDFSDTTAKEIMVPRTDMHAVEVGTPYDELLKLTLETGFSRFPVYEESIDRVVGIFFTKSLLAPPATAEKGNYLRRKMGPALFVPETKKISEVLKLFQRNRLHMAIVVDEFGGTEGVVTLEDIIEELLGEIHDEFDTEQERVQEIPGGGFVADARVQIEELETFIKIKFPEERGYESLGGFLMEVAGDVPAEGWQHEYEGLAFYVQEADLNRVIKVRIERLSEASGEAGTADRPSVAVGHTSK